MRSAAITLQAYWRGYAARLLAARMRVAYALQSVIRMRKQHVAFDELRSGTILAQTLWRGRCARVLAARIRLAHSVQSVVGMRGLHKVKRESTSFRQTN